MEDSGLDMDKENPERIGVIVSTGVGGLEEIHSGNYIFQQRS